MRTWELLCGNPDCPTRLEPFRCDCHDGVGIGRRWRVTAEDIERADGTWLCDECAKRAVP